MGHHRGIRKIKNQRLGARSHRRNKDDLRRIGSGRILQVTEEGVYKGSEQRPFTGPTFKNT